MTSIPTTRLARAAALLVALAAPADYVTADEMTGHVRAALARLSDEPGRDVFVHVGFHQETAARYAGRVERALTRLKALEDDRLVFETLSASAAAARTALE